MLELFSTSRLPIERRGRAVADLLNEHFDPYFAVDVAESVDCTLYGAVIAGRRLLRHRSSGSDLYLKTADGAVSQNPVLHILEHGYVRLGCAGQDVAMQAGDMVISDGSCRLNSIMLPASGVQGLRIELPRAQLHGMLGPIGFYAGRIIRGSSANAILARGFFGQLLGVFRRLDAAGTARMMAVGVELVAAAITERLSMEALRPLHGTALVQRAKTHVEANLHDPDLGAGSLAAAMGVSLRRLQQLFRERDRNVSDWIWQRRLERAAQLLSDPGCVHLSVGSIAYGTGFVNQAHFASRFRKHFGACPSDWRKRPGFPHRSHADRAAAMGPAAS